ncbi:MAG TPA: sporulation protein YunB [Candidatus Excrementavichristensenella intestinipullorum]|nr:sporulation protein YunB [Candidatus Excrementavichristensenella intestinipullorum]
MTSPGKRRVKRHIGRILLVAAILLAALTVYGLNNLSTLMIAMAEARARQLAVEGINSAVDEVMEGSGGYSGLVQVITDESGQVAMLKANTLLMNQLASEAALVAQRNLQALEDEGVLLPLGAALGISLLGDTGPFVRVGVVPVGSVTTQFVTAFESAGINQTRHEISLEVSTLMNIVVPTGANPVTVNAYVPVAEYIIVGRVPESYVNVPDTDSMLNMIP